MEATKIKRNMTDKRHGNYVKCKWCGRIIYIEPRKIGKNNFCSYYCYVEDRKGQKAHPNTIIGLRKGTELRRSQKGKKWEEIFGEEKAKIAHKKDHERKIKEWRNLEYRERQMKYRTPDRFIKIREKIDPIKRKENMSRIAKRYNK